MSLGRRSASQFLVGCNWELVGVNVLAVAVEYFFQGKRSRHRCALPAPAGHALQSERADVPSLTSPRPVLTADSLRLHLGIPETPRPKTRAARKML